MAFAGKLHIHIITEQKSLTFTESLTFMKHKTQKNFRKSKIVRTADYNCAYVSKMAVLIIFPVILQTVVNIIMLSIRGQIAKKIKINKRSESTVD